MPIGVKPTVDFAFKKIFGSPENSVSLIGLLNAILELRNPITDVEILNPFNRQEFEGDKVIVLDVKARDSTGRWLNIEMQVSVYPGLLRRLTFYACSLYVEQLEAGDNYSSLRPAISVCLLSRQLFADSSQPHHRFRLTDSNSGRHLEDGVEVHTLELTKYNLSAETITEADQIRQWAFFLLLADQYDAADLKTLLPAVEFQQAIAVIETIAAKTEDRTMYDQRMKAQRDYEWTLQSVREEGREEGHKTGREEGREEGVAIGKIQMLQDLLGESLTPSTELAKMDAALLTQMLAELQDRVRNRDT